MSVKCAIITMTNSNVGNRLQNYATQEVLKKHGLEPITIRNITMLDKKKSVANYAIRMMASLIRRKDFVDTKNKENCFLRFNKNIHFSKLMFNWWFHGWADNFDYYFVGSDQVWNPDYRLTEYDLCMFGNGRKVSFAASLGVDKLEPQATEKVKYALTSFDAISVREDKGKEILSGLTDKRIDVICDPTMLLTQDEWLAVERKPDQLDNEKYILLYFLGEIDEQLNIKINDFADSNKFVIYSLLDKKNPMYETGPSEFIYLIRHSEMIITDSFHASVFSIIFNKPFMVVERVDDKMQRMGSRLDTLLRKFNLENRKYSLGEDIASYFKIENIRMINSILESERSHAMRFLQNAIQKK